MGIERIMPIQVISDAARAEKSARHGHISTLGFWFARRPTGLSRVLIAAAGIDQERIAAVPDLCEELLGRYPEARGDVELSLVRLMEDLAPWRAYRDGNLMSLAGRLLAASGIGTIMDPFSGGGSIPLEGARLGLTANAGDLNPAAVILLQTMLKSLPNSTPEVLAAFERCIAEGSRRLADTISRELDGPTATSTLAAILWAWQVQCPSCDDRFPLIANPRLRTKNPLATAVVRQANGVWKAELVPGAGSPTIRSGKATCPNCLHEIGSSVLMQYRRDELMDEVPYCAVWLDGGKKTYSVASEFLESLSVDPNFDPAFETELAVPLDPSGVRHLWSMPYGVTHVGDVFSARQKVVLGLAIRTLQAVGREASRHLDDSDSEALEVLLALVGVRLSLYSSRHSWWQGVGEFPAQTFVRQALPMVWNYVEIPPISIGAGGLTSAAKWVKLAGAELVAVGGNHDVWQGSATKVPLRDASVDLVVTDPPYFDSITYAYLSDVFYPIYRYALAGSASWGNAVSEAQSPRAEEAIVDRTHKSVKNPKGAEHFTEVMTQSFRECARVLKPAGRLVVMYGHKKEIAWTSLLTAINDAGLAVVDAVELDSERGNKFKHAVVEHLGTSVSLFCEHRTESRRQTLEEVRALCDGPSLVPA